ncbi:MAG: heme exporter protein CcmB [Thermoanaerobaculia bacterium]|nr:heme exporter protein CcmB [Thermoanaerobaculia bacterium]
MSWVRQAVIVLKKDALLEWRGRSRFVSVLLFGVVTLLLFSFAVGPDSSALRAGAAGFLVLALLLSSTLGLAESFRLEQEDRGLEGLLLVPVEPLAIFYGKALGSTLLLLVLAPVLVPIALVLYAVELDWLSLGQLLGIWLLAAAGLSAPGTLYAAMTSRLRSQDVVLPVLLFPLVVPVLLGSVKAMALALAGDPMEQMRSWLLLLAGFDVIYWSLCGVLFPFAIEEG